MDYQTSSVALSQKLSTGYSIYDGVFTSAPSKFTVSSFSDFGEIFGGSSSIPVLELPELKSAPVDARSSKLDYSNVFGGFADSDFPVAYEELFAEPEQKRTKKTRKQAERLSPPKEAKSENLVLSNETAYESFDGVKKFSMSYNKSNHRSKSFSAGTTRVAELHAVPAYTCLIDESTSDGDEPVSEGTVQGNRVMRATRDQPAGDAGKQTSGGGVKVQKNNSNWKSSTDELFNSNKIGQANHPSNMPPFLSQLSEGSKPVSKVANDATVNGFEKKMEGNDQMKPTRDLPANDASKQTSGGVINTLKDSNRRRSSSVDKLFYSGEIAQGNRPPKMPPLPSLSKGQSEFEKAMASRIGVSDNGTCADSVWSTLYFDEEVDTNSAASASVAALTKAIEEAQASIQMAKEMMGGKKVGLQSRVKVIVDNGKKFEFKRGGLFDKASTPKEKKALQVNVEGDARVCVSGEPEKVTGAIEDADKCIGVKETREETHGKKIAEFPSISKEKKTLESYDKVDVTDNVSAGPEDVIAAFEHADKLSSLKDIKGKVIGKEYKPTPTDHRREEADDSEEAEQFYEFADTGEEDVSEAAEEFYEFADTSEPESSDAAEDFIDFGDIKEHCDTKLENEEAKSTRKMFQFVHEDDHEMKKTGMELLTNPDQGSKKLEIAIEQKSEVEKISNAVGGMPEFEDDVNQLASAHESSDHKENEMKPETCREHDETRKLNATSVKENLEEKQNGEERRFETQEIQEMEDVEIKLVAQEWVENEKIDSDTCIQEEIEREQKDTPREKDTERSLNIDSRQEIIETVDDFCDKKDFEKRLTDDCDQSEGNEKLQDTREHEKILEGATCQMEECENRLESFKLVEAEPMHIPIGESTEDAKVKVAQEDQKNLDCNFAAADNLYEQGVSEDLISEQGSAGYVEYGAYVEESLKVPAAEEEGGVTEVAETVIEIKENDHQSEFVEEKNGMEEKGLSEIDGLTPGVKHPEMLKQMEDATEIPSFDKNGANVSINGMSFEQKQDDQVGRESNEIGKEVEEFESGDIIEDVMEAEVSLNQGRNKNNSKTRKRWFSANEEVSETLIKLKEKGNQSESIEEEDVMEEKVICEIEGIAPGVGLAEILKQMEDVTETQSSDTNGVSVCGNARNYGQEEDSQFPREPEVACNLGKHDEDLGEINRDIVEPEVAAVKQGENMNNTKSPHRKRWFDDGNNTKVAQPPLIFGRKGGSLHHDVVTSRSIEGSEENQQATQRPQERKITYSSLGGLQQENNGSVQTNLSAEESETDQSSQEDVKERKNESQATLTEEVERKMENQQESQTAKELEICDSLQKEVEVEKERLRQKAARRREREIQKERRAVERAMREARERAYAEARDKAAETRQKVMAEAQGKSRKTSVLANDNSLAEKASKEANLKVERAAVERATVEARERALEKALAEKAANEAGKQAKRPVSEKLSGASRDTRAKPSVDPDSKGSCSSSTSKGPNPSNQGDSSLAERSDGNNGQAAQRNKARLEINQRTAERAAKALAEKNNRDLLQQQEQDERNRLAEALDAEVKRWSSGKERNLRALLSTLQYILGPDSGWKPVPLSDIVDAVAVKKAYRKAALFVHPDKLQQRGASIQQKYTCEKVFDLLKEAWNRFNKEER